MPTLELILACWLGAMQPQAGLRGSGMEGMAPTSHRLTPQPVVRGPGRGAAATPQGADLGMSRAPETCLQEGELCFGKTRERRMR